MFLKNLSLIGLIERLFRFPQNDIDASGICPDQVEGAELWDFDDFGSVEINGRTIILDRSVDIEGKVKNKCFEKKIFQTQNLNIFFIV